MGIFEITPRNTDDVVKALLLMAKSIAETKHFGEVQPTMAILNTSNKGYSQFTFTNEDNSCPYTLLVFVGTKPREAAMAAKALATVFRVVAPTKLNNKLVQRLVQE